MRSQFKTVAVCILAIGAWLIVSYLSELPAYKFERAAKEGMAQIPGARLVNSIKIAEIGSPISWFWPRATIMNFAIPDPIVDDRFYLISPAYEEPEPMVFLLDVDCEKRSITTYGLDEPATSFPARTLWGDPVVAPNGKTYRLLKSQIEAPQEWLRSFCESDWTTERKAAAKARLKATPP